MIGVILAAGKGSRLGNLTLSVQKCLLPLNEATGLSLLDYNIAMLESLQVSKIVVVTGYCSEKIEAHVSCRDGVEIVYNPFWAHCNVLGSLYMALGSVEDAFYFVHGDTIAETAIWEKLRDTPGEIVFPYDVRDCGDEEMKVLVDGGELQAISKELDQSTCTGEFIGVARFSERSVAVLRKAAKALFMTRGLNLYMEAAAQKLIDDGLMSVTPLDITGHDWVEVDFPEDYEKAKRLFGPGRGGSG